VSELAFILRRSLASPRASFPRALWATITTTWAGREEILQRYKDLQDIIAILASTSFLKTIN